VAERSVTASMAGLNERRRPVRIRSCTSSLLMPKAAATSSGLNASRGGSPVAGYLTSPLTMSPPRRGLPAGPLR
jgi:hypothetical protein